MKRRREKIKIMRYILKFVSANLPRDVVSTNKHWNKPSQTSKLGSPEHKIAV